MGNQLCFQCFKMKGEYDVCPHCGYGDGAKAKQVYQLAPGTVLRGRYIIGVSIGNGGFGITYKAFDTVLSVVVAVKEFYPARLVNRGEGELKVGIFSGDKEQEFKRQLARFLEEARNMAIFSKEKDIINVFDYFEENQTAYIIMEYVDAPLLKAKLKEKGKFGQEEAVGYMRALLSALSKVHYHGIIHKDVSPDNIFLTGKDTIKLFDFGAAKFQGTQTERTDDVVVKAGYTPPEQYRSKNAQGAFMDVYAAGAVFYEMLTGEKPMEAPDRSISDELKKPHEFQITVDERIERVILKALALKPELRFQTAEQFKAALASQKKVELPEEELKRLKLRKTVLTVGIGASLFLAGVVLLLSQTVFSGRGKIDVAKLKEDQLEIWMPVTDQAAGERLTKTFLSSVKKECPKLHVTVRAIEKKAYEKTLKEAAGAGDLPEVFCTEGIDAAAYCADLSKLFRTMDLSSYLYMEEWEKEHAYEIPSALQAGVLYVSQEKVKEPQDFVELSKLSEEDGLTGFAGEKGVYKKFMSSEDSLSQIAGDLSCMDAVKKVTVDQMPPTDFTAVPILDDGALVAALEHCYGVNKDATENQQEAGMFLLSLLLSDGMQSASYMGNEEGLPLNKDVLEEYKENKMTTYLSFLKEYDLADAALCEGRGWDRIKEEIVGDGK